jgi:hypothetical protein
MSLLAHGFPWGSMMISALGLKLPSQKHEPSGGYDPKAAGEAKRFDPVGEQQPSTSMS